MVCYIGIDPGSSSAIAIMQDYWIQSIITIDTSKLKSWGAKLHHYMTKLMELLVMYAPEAVYCEEPFIGPIKLKGKLVPRPQAAKAINKWLGVIELTCYMYNAGMKVGFINPSVVKKTITGFGKSEKESLAVKVRTMVVNPKCMDSIIDQKNWDETDSVAIAIAGYRTGGL